jgi:hypothetical protein
MKKLFLAALIGCAMPAAAQVVFYDPYLGAVVPAYPSAWMAPCAPWCVYESRNRIQERRRARFDALRADTPPAAPPEPFGIPRAVAPPTSESEIQPEYRAASRVREEFDTRSKVLPQFEATLSQPVQATTSNQGTQGAAPAKRRARPMMPCPNGAPEC